MDDGTHSNLWDRPVIDTTAADTAQPSWASNTGLAFGAGFLFSAGCACILRLQGYEESVASTTVAAVLFLGIGFAYTAARAVRLTRWA